METCLFRKQNILQLFFQFPSLWPHLYPKSTMDWSNRSKPVSPLLARSVFCPALLNVSVPTGLWVWKTSISSPDIAAARICNRAMSSRFPPKAPHPQKPLWTTTAASALGAGDQNRCGRPILHRQGGQTL
jgi:hypothetical protein